MNVKVYVYKITSPSGKSYIGVSKNPKKRFKGHAKGDFPVGRAIRKYGINNISFRIIDEADSYANAYKLEQKYIAENNTMIPNGYNGNSGGVGGRKFCSEIIEKIKITRRKNAEERGYWKPEESIKRGIETRRKNAKERGYYISQAGIEKRRKKNTGRKRSKEARENMRNAQLGKKRSREAINKMVKTRQEKGLLKLTSEMITIILHAYHDGYYTGVEIAKAFGVSGTHIYNIVNGNKGKTLLSNKQDN